MPAITICSALPSLPLCSRHGAPDLAGNVLRHGTASITMIGLDGDAHDWPQSRFSPATHIAMTAASMIAPRMSVVRDMGDGLGISAVSRRPALLLAWNPKPAAIGSGGLIQRQF